LKYEDLILTLKEAYNNAAEERDQKEIDQWKFELQQQFYNLLSSEGKLKLLEIGAGIGNASLFFKEQGLKVTCTDLSPENVKRCKKKGLDAYVMDFKNLIFPTSSFDAVYAINCLLHVPRKDFSHILKQIHDLLTPEGVFFLGQHGGRDFEGIYPEDHYNPKRFFSLMNDDEIQRIAGSVFSIERFDTLQLDPEAEFHFQYLYLRRR
jgi:SAM-dependent methyltransferase